MAIRIDHFMYGVPSLDEGMSWAENTFGTEAAYGGEHVGLGTRNALMSLGNTYLEIIAPDPAQPLEGTFGEALAGLSKGGLVTWCAEDTLTEVANSLSALDVSTSGPNRTRRQTTDGGIMEWELLFPSNHPFVAACRFSSIGSIAIIPKTPTQSPANFSHCQSRIPAQTTSKKS